ncbi:nucleotide exchange factor GrpE [Candidatus Bathyarchaeota archaeon]|nr:nucleotide exchange factor GrpE [Candidatus Bathyarchaeota archaeon]
MTKKELMKRVEELEEALRAERERAETYLRQLKYAKADLENLRKMVKRQVEEAVRSGNERLIRELLVVLDDLELALEAGGKAGDREALMEGVEMVLRKFRKILESEGLKPIEALGRPFNPDLHEAVMRVEDPDRPEGVVIEEVRRGYMLRGKVIRPSMVKVSVNPRREEKEGARDG